MTIKIVESQGDSTLNNGQLAVVGRLDNAVKMLEEKEAEFAQYLNELKARQDEVAKLKESLYQMMTESQVDKLESEHLIITAVSPKPRHTLDVKAIAAMNPNLFAELDAQYGKDTPVKGYVKLTSRG